MSYNNQSTSCESSSRSRDLNLAKKEYEFNEIDNLVENNISHIEAQSLILDSVEDFNHIKDLRDDI